MRVEKGGRAGVPILQGGGAKEGLRRVAPDAGEGGLDLLLEAGEQFPVGGHEGLLGFDLRHDLLKCEGCRMGTLARPVFVSFLCRGDASWEEEDGQECPSYTVEGASPQMRARVAWILCSKRVISSRFAATRACSASISATMACCVARGGTGIVSSFNTLALMP